METRKKIESVQALRAIAFIGIFLVHANYSFHWSPLGVSIFFCLSGFLLFRNNERNEIDTSIKSRIEFSLKRLKKLYPLHIITTFFATIWVVVSLYRHGFLNLKSILTLLFELILNITLTQSWYPDSNINTSLNGVSWYLSTIAFLYFMFPLLLKIVKKCKKQFLILTCVFGLLAEILLCFIMLSIFGSGSGIYIWFMYCFPVFRLFDFYVGMCAGKIIPTDATMKIVYATFLEMTVFFVTAVTLYFNRRTYDSLIMNAINNWTTAFIPLSVMLIYIFSMNSGVITKMLSNKVLIFIGDISGYLFLIHNLVIIYFSFAINILHIGNGFYKHIFSALEFLLSVFAACLYKKINQTHKVKGLLR